MKQTSLMRRVVAGAAALAIGLAGALTLSAPAAAAPGHFPAKWDQKVHKKPWVKVTGAAECVEGEWHITWTVENKKKKGDAVVHKISREVEGIAAGDTIGSRGELTGTEVLPGDEVGDVTLDVTLKWGKFKREGSATVTLDENCTPNEDPGKEEPEELGEWTFDCEVLTITLRHPAQPAEPVAVALFAAPEPITFTLTTSTGETAEVTVEPGGEETVQFAAAEGMTVTIAIDGETIELEEPIEITSEEWAELDCDEEDEGEGGELPVTGSSTALLAAGALVLLAVGGGLYLVARRRRVTFTA